jgi:hypothetical protein
MTMLVVLDMAEVMVEVVRLLVVLLVCLAVGVTLPVEWVHPQVRLQAQAPVVDLVETLMVPAMAGAEEVDQYKNERTLVMKWKGLRQSTNVEDRTLEPTPEIPDGTIMAGDGSVWHNTTETEQRRKESNAAKDVARRGNNVPTPTSRPKTHDNLVTPGKWTTKSK